MTPRPSQEIINLFRQRFIQREDCYPLQIGSTGAYTVIREPLTDEIIADHLTGTKTIGLYSSTDSTTKWLCIDIDTLNEEVLRQVQQRIRQLRAPFLTEFSGKKGYHIWIFFDKSYPNKLARQLGNLIGTGHEIFPKQDHIEPGKLGNLVKAPLGIHQVTGSWCQFINDELRPLTDQLDSLRHVELVNPNLIDCHQLHESHCSATASFGAKDPAPQSIKLNIPILRDCVHLALRTGTDTGSRNQVGHILASELRRIGVEPWHTRQILTVLWNPKNRPPLTDSEINTIMGSAYNGDGYRYGCQASGILRAHLKCRGYDKCHFMSIAKCCLRGNRAL